MKYIVLKTFLTDSDQIWVARLNPDDPIYEFDLYDDCVNKALELQSADTSGRLYKASQEQFGVTY